MNKILIPILALGAALSACAPAAPETPYSEKIETIKKNLSKNGDHFIFFCDTHTEKHLGCVTPSIIDEALGKLPVDKVIFGGDFCMTLNGCANKEDLDTSIEKFEENIAATKAHGCDFYCIRGNHDMTTGTINPDDAGYTYSQSYVHTKIMGWSEGSPLVESEDLSCNYYVDSPEKSIRYIILDPYSGPDEDEFVRYGIRMNFAGASRDWCEESLKTLPEGWKAVVLLHQGLNKATGCCDYRNMRGVLELVSDNSDKVALVLHGHVHKDSETFEKGVLHVSTTSCLYNESKGDLFGAVSRSIDSTDESALDVVDIDLAKGRINMWRLGFGYDRLINITPKNVKVGDTLRIKPSLKKVDSWKIYDADGIIVSSWVGWENDAITENKYATLEGDRVNAVAPGEVVVVATDEAAKSREYFHILVVE